MKLCNQVSCCNIWTYREFWLYSILVWRLFCSHQRQKYPSLYFESVLSMWCIYSQLTVYGHWVTEILQIMLMLGKMDRNSKSPQHLINYSNLNSCKNILGVNRKCQSPPRTSMLRNRGITVVIASISASAALSSGLSLLPVSSGVSPANYTSVLRYFKVLENLKWNWTFMSMVSCACTWYIIPWSRYCQKHYLHWS